MIDPEFLADNAKWFLIIGAAGLLAAWFFDDLRARFFKPGDVGDKGSAFIRGNPKNVHLANNYSAADTFIDGDPETITAENNLHDPTGRSLPKWGAIKAWLSRGKHND